jgi:hypothetical protein
MQSFIIFTKTNIFIWFKYSFAYFNSRRSTKHRNTYFTRPLRRCLLKDSNEHEFAFFQCLYQFPQRFEIYWIFETIKQNSGKEKHDSRPFGRNWMWAVKLAGHVTSLCRGLAHWVGPTGHPVCGLDSSRQRPWRPIHRGVAAARTTSPSWWQGVVLWPPGDRGRREDSVLRLLELGRSPAATDDSGGFSGDAGPLRRGRCG